VNLNRVVAGTYANIKRRRSTTLPPIYEKGSGWYKSWYFDLRVVEEISRSTRYQLPLTLVAICLPTPLTAAGGRTGFNKRLAELATTSLRRTDIPAVLSDNELAVLLPQTASLDAEVVVDRLTQALALYEPVIGAASYPEDGREAARLLLIAEHRALGSLHEKGLIRNTVPRRERKTYRAA